MRDEGVVGRSALSFAASSAESFKTFARCHLSKASERKKKFFPFPTKRMVFRLGERTENTEKNARAGEEKLFPINKRKTIKLRPGRGRKMHKKLELAL
jgi:hypothetical protein